MTGMDQPPAHLRSATKLFWRWVTAQYELEPPHTNLLTLAYEALDRCAEAREILAREGLTVKDDRGNPRPHPLLSAERASQVAHARLMREIGLDATGNANSPRPPALRYSKGR